MSRVLKVAKATVVDLFFGFGVPRIYNIQLGPEKSADAANTISPSQPTAVAEFRKGERVVACFLDGLGDLAEAGMRTGGASFSDLRRCRKASADWVSGRGLRRPVGRRRSEKARKGQVDIFEVYSFTPRRKISLHG